MSNFLPKGIGTSPGTALGTASPLYMSGKILYVSSASGDASYSGLDRYHPLDTLANALSAASAGDVIVLMEDHDETISSAVTFSSRIAVIGEGYADGKPKATLQVGHASNDLLVLNADGCMVQNVLFKPHATSGSSANCIRSGSADIFIDACYFEMDEHSDGQAIDVSSGAANWRIRNCSFVVTETTVDASPDSGIRLAGAMTGLVMEGCVFDAGEVGFDTQGAIANQPWGFDGSAGATTNLQVTGLSLLRGAEFKVHASSTGWIEPSTTTGAARVIW